jgi:hypothetical protein
MEDEIEWLERVSPENAAKFKCMSPFRSSRPHTYIVASAGGHKERVMKGGEDMGVKDRDMGRRRKETRSGTKS